MGNLVISGSIATWGIELESVQAGIFLDVPREERLRRLIQRERERFGSRIDTGGDLYDQHREFVEWASGYDMRMGRGRNQITDIEFLRHHCERIAVIDEVSEFNSVVSQIRRFLNNPKEEAKQDAALEGHT